MALSQTFGQRKTRNEMLAEPAWFLRERYRLQKKHPKICQHLQLTCHLRVHNHAIGPIALCEFLIALETPQPTYNYLLSGASVYLDSAVKYTHQSKCYPTDWLTIILGGFSANVLNFLHKERSLYQQCFFVMERKRGTVYRSYVKQPMCSLQLV